ncbi:glycosyltransferase family A protein [Aureisphaera galaxeae]|uniref:glycosyltransferase n=1 Tax=Aureisphaera galaxeae TaxID=1538023 RepID=UPI0023502B28|nr:glycosyltransferase family A protein [Aureisphaera galaxeae]MDC8005630.1 glycosyltransferase family A protein [Aureisphaera galaxeae]
MRIAIVIPIHNEEAHLPTMLDSLLSQSFLPETVVLVNDHSTDGSQKIIDEYASQHSCIQTISLESSAQHEPGSKVINAFYKGYALLKGDFDLIGKFDADLILPSNYFENMAALFQSSPKIGLAGGNLYIEKEGVWVYENISEKTKVRGPIKLYRKACFEAIGGLKKSIGWDTVDGLLASYHGWQSATDTTLHVKHLKPTGQQYASKDAKKQGEAFRKMRYGFWLTFIAAGKLALKKGRISYFFGCINSFLKTPKDYIVTQQEGAFIRSLRWKGIRKKVF